MRIFLSLLVMQLLITACGDPTLSQDKLTLVPGSQGDFRMVGTPTTRDIEQGKICLSRFKSVDTKLRRYYIRLLITSRVLIGMTEDEIISALGCENAGLVNGTGTYGFRAEILEESEYYMVLKFEQGKVVDAYLHVGY